MINNKFSPYIVTDDSLFLTIPDDDYKDGIVYYLRKWNFRPNSSLIGKWIAPLEAGDIEVTFTENQITFKRGRQTQTRDYSTTGTVISFGSEYLSDYFLIDDKHMIAFFRLGYDEGMVPERFLLYNKAIGGG
jgi:hypothetical protein